MTVREPSDNQDPGFVSTGQLPDELRVEQLVQSAYEQFSSVTDGNLSSVYPALLRVFPDLFGIAVVATDGRVVERGDARHLFTIMSVSKPFVFALICEILGPSRIKELVGANATGLPFNSVTAIEASQSGATNPMVNPGAIATTSLTPGDNGDEKWSFLRDGLGRFAGRELSLNEEIFASASETNHRNRGIVSLLETLHRIYCDPMQALDLYTRQCSLDVTAFDLAVMGATLAGGGINPVTGERVVDAAVCRYTLAVMATAGLYETSGDWLYEVGLPAKSGIGGGIVTVAPGKGGMGTFAPLLDAAGNSIKGQLVARKLSKQLGLDLFVSQAVTRANP